MNENKLPCDRHDERIGNLEKKVETMEKSEREDTKILAELSTLMRIALESNDKRDKINEEQSKALVDTSITLGKINDNLDGMNKRMDKIEIKMEKIQEEKIEVVIEKTKGMVELSKGKVALIGTIIVALCGLVTTLVTVFAK